MAGMGMGMGFQMANMFGQQQQQMQSQQPQMQQAAAAAGRQVPGLRPDDARREVLPAVRQAAGRKCECARTSTRAPSSRQLRQSRRRAGPKKCECGTEIAPGGKFCPTAASRCEERDGS
jgi:hypothetical protein